MFTLAALLALVALEQDPTVNIAYAKQHALLAGAALAAAKIDQRVNPNGRHAIPELRQILDEANAKLNKLLAKHPRRRE